MDQPDIFTERLRLRAFTLDDAGDVQRLAGNYNVAKMTLNMPHPYADGMAESWISTHEEMRAAGTHTVYAITLQASGDITGCISLIDIDDNSGKLGYWIGEPYWGRGICTEATIALIQFAFNGLQLSRIHAEHLVANPASGRVMQKAGMVLTGVGEVTDRNGNMAAINYYEIVNR